jgi:cysteinyl-tRNA synthetase
MTLRIYNTLTREKEEFHTLEPGKVRMYVCGPTVYDRAHIGHAMSALVFDIVRRYLEYSGYEVRFVMNFTDVDDKIIDRARQSGADPFQLAQGYIGLQAQPGSPEHQTRHPQPARDAGNGAYPGDDPGSGGPGLWPTRWTATFYYRVDFRPGLRASSQGLRLESMNAGARIQVDDRKEHPMDFALWKAAKPGEPAWDSPWGKGRPGWHIECSAMNMHHLGEQIAIHGGGQDLIFPHHENEIAQTEALYPQAFRDLLDAQRHADAQKRENVQIAGKHGADDEFLAEHPGDVMRLLC